jgi:hypothetical protein
MKRSSIKQAIVNLVEETDSSVTRNIPLLIKWATRLESRIGTLKGYKLKCSMAEAIQGTIKLPDDCIELHKIYAGDHTEDIINFYRDMFYKDLPADDPYPFDAYDESDMVWSTLQTVSFMPIIWDDWGDEVHLMNDYTGEEFTLWYSSIELDQEGYPIVNESHIEAIKMYLKFKLAERKLWHKFSSDKMIRQNELGYIGDLRSSYRREVRNARAEDNTETEYERNQY